MSLRPSMAAWPASASGPDPAPGPASASTAPPLPKVPRFEQEWARPARLMVPMAAALIVCAIAFPLAYVTWRHASCGPADTPWNAFVCWTRSDHLPLPGWLGRLVHPLYALHMACLAVLVVTLMRLVHRLDTSPCSYAQREQLLQGLSFRAQNDGFPVWIWPVGLFAPHVLGLSTQVDALDLLVSAVATAAVASRMGLMVASKLAHLHMGADAGLRHAFFEWSIWVLRFLCQGVRVCCVAWVVLGFAAVAFAPGAAVPFAFFFSVCMMLMAMLVAIMGRFYAPLLASAPSVCRAYD